MSADPSLSVPDNGFDALGLPAELCRTLAEIGYESPSPIQAATIPPLLNGRDVLGQAQTGTGKTAAFALPTLARIAAAGIHAGDGKPRALVLTPTRELAIQVAEAFGRYAAHLPGLRILAVYGGQRYGPQLQALRRGVEVVVGTPGRIIDHLERGCLDLSRIDMLVLDEADEMLRMGFIDDVETVLRRLPEPRQIALFSATMPAPIKRIAQTCLHAPVEVAIQAKSAAANIRQRHWMVAGMHKLDALTRILEVEPFDAMIVFTRTKLGAEELAEKLTMRGFAAAAINGDMEQKQRERTIQKLKDRQIDILVATDVAARGLDVERISHVLNYDIPYDTESYVHRIGRTGRAGRAGEAILFATPRERGMLRAIERATGQSITPMTLPSVEAVNARRVDKFMDTITQALASPDLAIFSELVERYAHEQQVPAARIAAALARRLQGDRPLLLTPEPERGRRDRRRAADDAAPAGARAMPGHRHTSRERSAARPPTQGDIPLETFHIAVGHIHGVQPGNIVGAIANEAGLDSGHIGRIRIHHDHSLIELPTGMPRELLAHLKQVWVSGRQLQMRRLRADDPRRPPDADPGTGARAPHRARRSPPRRRR